MHMGLSSAGSELIKRFESCRLMAYPDPATNGDPWTIGWGHTGSDVVPGLIWTQEQAGQEFAMDISRYVRDVNFLLDGHECTQFEFDALVSFAYNVGPDIDDDDKAEGLGDSTLLKLFLAGEKQAAADQFLLWKRAGGRVMRGLLNRRRVERVMFLGQDWQAEYQAIYA